jgi:2-iminobutanoate/2-iminopropanoate deaminase
MRVRYAPRVIKALAVPLFALIVAFAPLSSHAQQVSANGVKTPSPPGAIAPTGTWSLATRAGDFVYVTDMARQRPIVNKVQEQLWGAGPYPPRTIVEVKALNQDDIVEVEGTFYAPAKQR